MIHTGFASAPATETKPAAGQKWRLQAVARRILPDFQRLQACGCQRARDPFDPDRIRRQPVEVWTGGDKAWFTGLVRCGSVWVCPVCAAKIGEGRREELQKGIDNALAYGHGVTLVTLTFSHGIGDQLADVLPAFSKALRRFKSGRAYKQLCADFGFMGEVRALEVTHGQNGWHPHTHALTFTRQPLKGHRLTQYKRRLFVLWRRACAKEGLQLPTYRHGVDVRGAKYAAEYVAKWGFATELAAPRAKKGKKGRTPWQLLADAAAGDKRAAWLWREFAQCFHGKQQLRWSPGLKRRLSLEGPELTDQQLLELPEAPEVEEGERRRIVTIDDTTWFLVLRAEARGDVLEAARRSRRETFALLNRIRCSVPLVDGSLIGPREDWEI